MKFLALLSASALGLGVWAFGAVTGPASAQTAEHASARVTTVVVTMGKPTEFAFTLSKFSKLPVGKVRFEVTNAGKLGHSFKVCRNTATTAKANRCVGVATKVLAGGKSATLTVTFTKKGKYEFLCTVSGHAAGGMKGLLGVGGAVSAREAAGKSSVPGVRILGCPFPKATTVNVGMADFSFSGVPVTVPCGTVTIVEHNTGAVKHNFSIAGSPPGPIIGPGRKATYSVALAPGTYGYQSNVGNQASQGMIGSLVVSG